MLKLTWSRVAVWRARRHYLDRRAPARSMLDVVSRLCGLHAQLMSAAELTAWARIEGLDRQAVQRALWEERTLVKTWAMRGTLHLLPAEELPLWHAALSTSRRYLKPALWQKHFGITIEELDRLTEAVAAALDGRVMTREELLPGDLRHRVYRPQGWISPVLLVNGRMEGTWRHAVKGSRVEVVVEPFVKARPWVRRAAAQEAERLAAFLGCTLRLAWKS